MKGIDVSEFNGIIDYDKVAKEVDFVIIRAGFGARTKLDKKAKEDKLFRRNIEGFLKVGIPVGIYYYSYALNEEEAKEEASFILSAIKDYKDRILFPVVIDMEDSDSYKSKNGFPDNKTLCNICQVACDTIGKSGYYPMIYANLDYFKNYLTEDTISKYNRWLAWWNKEAIEKVDRTKYQILQYSSIGKIDGIGSCVDMNESFVEYHKVIAYMENVRKIQEIKLFTGLEDITMQYLSCYKFGSFLIDKIYKRIKDKKRAKKTDENIEKVVQKEYGFEDKTILFMELYIYGESLFLKLYRAICEEKDNGVDIGK